MKTVKSLLAQMTDAKAVVHSLKETLRELDSDYGEEEAKFLSAAAVLEKEVGDITPSAAEYLAAMEQKLASDLMYLGWLGVQFHRDCFENPVNAVLLERDFEGLHRESRMAALPMAQQAQRTMDAFYRALPEEKRELTSDIIGFYTYLQTTGYKLAHYFGFRLADGFLGYVIPGYTGDLRTTNHYADVLRQYLRMDIRKLE